MPLASPSSGRPFALGLCVLALSAASCASFLGDASRDARVGCDKKSGPSCFAAGSMVAEKNGGTNAEAVHLYIRGCAVRHSPSCDALGNVKGPLRAQALLGGCNAGDLVSCAKRADELTEAGNVDEARGVRHEVCKKSIAISSGSPAREVEGIAESCAALARMIAAGLGGGRDEVAAAKLDVLAMTLRNEAVYRHEREDDAKQLPAPAAVAAEPPRRKNGMKTTPKVDPGLAEREQFRREYEARHAAREAWIASVQSSMTAAAQQKEKGDPSLPTAGALERATAALALGGGSGGTSGGASAGPTQCQACVESCGSMSRCAADDFGGGRCGHLRCAAAGPCAELDTCVAECSTRVDTCTKACGDCAEPGKVDASKAVKP